MKSKTISASMVLLVGMVANGSAGSPPPPGSIRATIQVTGGTTCQQTVIGSAPNDFPVVHKLQHDTISWSGSAGAAGVTVTFASTGGVFPFHKKTLHNGEGSGQPTGAYNIYHFQKVVVGHGIHAITCSNPGTMGVHIDQ